MTLKKAFKILGLIALISIAAFAAFYLYITDFGRENILSAAPRRPKNEIPITYTIGWWANQKALSVDSLQVDIVESNLHLFNTESLISYKVFGTLDYKGSFQPAIKLVQLSERINPDTTLDCDRIIEINPVVKNIPSKSKSESVGLRKFEFKNEYIIKSNHYGISRIKFICGQKQQTITLQQFK